jgi:hypothetical protein
MTIITLNDWEGIYDDDGKILDQGHGINYDEVLKKLGYEVVSHYIGDDELDSLGNCLPEKLSDILIYIEEKQKRK